MPGPSTIPAGNVSITWVLNATLSPASVSNAVSNEQTFTVPGLRVGDFVAVSKPTVQSGLVISTARVSALNTLAVTFGNLSAATITPTASEVYTVKVDRYENYSESGSAPAGYTG